MATKILADINEMAFTLACGNCPIAIDQDNPGDVNVYFTSETKLPFGADNFNLTDTGENDVFLAYPYAMLDNGEHLRVHLNEQIQKAIHEKRVDVFKIKIKIQQAILAAQNFKYYLAGKDGDDNPHPHLNFPKAWAGGGLVTGHTYEIIKAAWTPKACPFLKFCELCWEGGGLPLVDSHDENPADALLLVRDAASKFYILGVSLKATFGRADITMYNGGICAFYWIVIAKTDLAEKKAFCPCTSTKKRARAACKTEIVLKEPYVIWKNSVAAGLGWDGPGTISSRKQIWTEKVTNIIEAAADGEAVRPKELKDAEQLILSKLEAQGGVRDSIYKQMMEEWKGVSNTLTSTGIESFTASVTNEDARNIIGGLYQFTHANISVGAPRVPYIKSTAFLNYTGKFPKFKTRVNAAALENFKILEAYIQTKFEAPNLDELVGDGAINIIIAKIAGVSILFCIQKEGGDVVQHFTIRVKLESKPPSNIKIDIKPVDQKVFVQTGGGIKQKLNCLGLTIEQKELLGNIWDMTYPDCPWNDDLPENSGEMPAEDDIFYTTCHDDLDDKYPDETEFAKLLRIITIYANTMKSARPAAALRQDAAGTAARGARRNAVKKMDEQLDAIRALLETKQHCFDIMREEELEEERVRQYHAAVIGDDTPQAYYVPRHAAIKSIVGEESVLEGGGCAGGGGGGGGGGAPAKGKGGGGMRRRRNTRLKKRRRRYRRTRRKKRRRRSRKKRHKKRTRRRHRRRH